MLARAPQGSQVELEHRDLCLQGLLEVMTRVKADRGLEAPAAAPGGRDREGELALLKSLKGGGAPRGRGRSR